MHAGQLRENELCQAFTILLKSGSLNQASLWLLQITVWKSHKCDKKLACGNISAKLHCSVHILRHFQSDMYSE